MLKPNIVRTKSKIFIKFKRKADIYNICNFLYRINKMIGEIKNEQYK